MGLTKTAGLIFGWYDNFDLLVSTPNGRRETHAMATEFQMHLAGGVHPGISSLIFPRLTAKQGKSVGKGKKIIPPGTTTRNTQGISYTEVCARKASLPSAQEKDTQWLNSLGQGNDAME